jgi:hypothetical protein
MEENNPVNETTSLSVERIIDLIRTVRNDLIKDFLNDDFLNKYYTQLHSKILSNVKREFLKRDLKELLISPVDLVHYSKLINQIRETGTASLAHKNADLFYREIETILNKYSI